MKKIICGLLMVTSTGAFASDYVCNASMNNGEAVVTQKLEVLAGTNASTTIGSFQFNSTETDAETLVLSIFNRAQRSQAASATTFFPRSGKPVNLMLRLEAGSASINCQLQ